MVLDHERLDVYNVALEFLAFANDVIERLPRGRSHLSDQFTRASTSIVLNLAEGAGKHSKPRYYLTARGSATESAALLAFAGDYDSSTRLRVKPVRKGLSASSRCSSSWPRAAKSRR